MAFIVGATIIGAGAAIGGALIGKKGAKDAAQAGVDASNAEIAYAKETRNLIRSDQEPYREAGYTALGALMDMTGLSAPKQPAGGGRRPFRAGGGAVRGENYLSGIGGRRGGRRLVGRAVGGFTQPYGRYSEDRVGYNVNELGPENVFQGGAYTRDRGPKTISTNSTGYVQPNGGALGPNGYPAENPGGVEGGYSFKTDPGYQFRFGEGMRALDRGMNAAGLAQSGGYARRAIRYGQDYASGEYQNVYNRIANIAGLGQVANQTNAQSALATSGQVGQALNAGGYARATGYLGQGNAIAGGINELANMPWDQIFARPAVTSGGGGSGIGHQGWGRN